MPYVIILLLVCLCFSNPVPAQKSNYIATDVCVVGGGSAGIGAALAASRAGAEVVLVEKTGKIGGTSTQSYVNNWEPGPGCSYSYEIFRRMSQKPGYIGVARNQHVHTSEEPYQLWLIDSTLNYNNTLRRFEGERLPFDIDEFNKVTQQMLDETGRCKLLLNTSFTKAQVKGNRIESIEAISASGVRLVVVAKIYIDCTGIAALCRNIGCKMMVGAEPQSQFEEPSAPDVANRKVNAISLCYQIKPSPDTNYTNPNNPQDFDYSAAAWVTGPVGREHKLTINPYGIIEGEEFLNQPYDSIYSQARKIIDKHWAKIRTYPPFRKYVFDSYAPELGIRESYRVKCEYILTQNDLLKGLSQQTHHDVITLADHPMDVHGKNTILKEIKEAYGVPYRCLIPKGWCNLLVAGKCAGFSHIAASSCRLSRTMMSLGHAAGFAASIAAREGLLVLDVPTERIQAEMNLKLRSKTDKDADPQLIYKTIGILKHNFLCCDNGNDSIFQISESGKIEWAYPAPNCQDVSYLHNGNILFSYHHGDEGRGGVIEVTKDKKIVFQYEVDGEVHTCQRLANGNTLVGINKNATIVEVDKQNKIRKTISLKTERCGHDAIRMARKLPNGNYLVCQEGDHLVAEYNNDGKLLKTFSSPGKCFEAIRLKNGNTLISDGSNCSVRELDTSGNMVWQITKDDFPEIKMNWLAGIKALPNGNILVCNWLGHGKYGEGIPAFEVSKNKKIVFYYMDNVCTKSISNISLIN